MTPSTDISSNLLELHVTVSDMVECLYILDGRFDQLRIFYVTCYTVLPCYLNIEHEVGYFYSYFVCLNAFICFHFQEKVLPNLRIFSLWCKNKIYYFDQLIVPLLRRMLNLEELDLNIIVHCYEKFLDGDTLKKDILIYMPQLYKFTFNICSSISHRNQTNFPLNEHIQKTFKYFSNNEIITYIDHFQEETYSQCHVYSCPYKWKVYNNITNQFRGGLFTTVTEVSIYDECPFEYEFFLRIAQSFPFMKDLTIQNRKAQNRKQFLKANNNNPILSIIEYPNLNRLDLSNTADLYVEFFLFNMNISLPNNLHLCVDYQSLKRVTYHFTRYKTRSNCVKLAALYLDVVDQINENVKNYFPNTCICHTFDFKLSK